MNEGVPYTDHGVSSSTGPVTPAKGTPPSSSHSPRANLHSQVFSFARNKITQLPNYFPQFRNLEVLKLERNPVEWPPKDIIHYDAKSETEGDMKTWITGIQEWIEYHVSFQDDSGYGETIEIKGTQEKHKPWQFPKRQASVDIDSSIHSRSFSVDSNASMNSDSFVDTHVASTNVEWPPKTDRPMMNFDSHHPSRDVYLGSPADSDTFDTRSTSSRPELSDAWHSTQLQSHLRTSSVTEPRQPVHTLGPAKSSLPDIHSPRWRLDSQPSSPEIPAPILQTLQPSISQNSARSIETRSDATPTSKTPSMAFERNSYFQRLSTMPQSVKLPPPLFCLVETARSILFVTSQIYQTIEHYANHAIDEKHAAVFRKVLEPANNDMMQLIRALDRYDTSSRKGTPSGPICRTLIESCRNTIAVTHKAVGLFAIQLRIAPCEDFRYSRWILLELYASTAEISVTWQNLVPHSDALKGFLSGKSGSLLSIPDPSTSSATRSDSLYPMARLRTNDLSAIRTHNARRHAGSFSHRDVEIGKDLPNYDEPPILPGRTPVSALRAMPKRQATAPPSMFSPGGSSSNITVPPVPLSRSTTEDTANSRRGHRLDDSIEPQQSLPRQKSVPRLKSFDLNADSRVRVDSGVIQTTLESLEATSQLWDTFEDSQASADLQIQDSLTRVRELSKKVSLALRVALDNDCSVDRYLFEDTVALSKLTSIGCEPTFPKQQSISADFGQGTLTDRQA
ncbi:hypothetical protein CC1G_13929 [Coprinopsis cinerea okayama7|uniref:Uncharacterized protein n=1 Tax=Coprinopsis cinerea (strain Okayama-7 / 130 / ATCC MYA-4618 / FGSC 9003) TaxID=240176 RepID=D6RKN7_COPC7|nr:hypothetical protein CC1G_13929 [Coprinopsis cinerea okayama7\|eukprot:XP_002911889.1 hypothetical protein CC1G_13929 [Coprinopsis cinerea okayama7\